MPTLHPRLNVVIEKPLYQILVQSAKKTGVSLSMKARDLIRTALELEDDGYWEKKANERSATFDSSKALSHEKIWKKSR